MGAEIDRLEIEVEAQVTKANNALDKLVGNLERLAGTLGSIDGNSFLGFSKGISDISSAMQGLKSADIRKTDFNRLAKGIAELTSLDTSGLSRTANAMNGLADSIMGYEAVTNSAEAVGNLAKGISKLGNKSVITAISNMPKLATALDSMMKTLAKTPEVNNNLIQMTNALANLASQGSKVGSTTRGMTSSLNGYSASAQRASKSSKGLASIFGRLYANFFWVKRGADKLWQSIETSMDYVETLNYFDAAFGQVAESAVSQWESAGYDSADAYYKSFSERAKELTSKMSGFRINESGTLTATGQTSLGIDPEKMMNYQATFGQMASSMGVASETSLKLSQALTEIGADLASVKNLDFDKVWNDMASGLAGMSRTLDKYGVNIRNVNLQQKLNELGIQANITALNQNDKALLRAIILLDSTRYAWGDLAETINQPANQLRLIESNFQNLSRTIGNLFLPAVSRTLPYVNAMVIALQRLATWIGNLLGIDLSKVTSSVAASNFDFGTIADEAEAATEAVNKLQKGIRSFDELNVITTSSDSKSGSGISSGLLDDAFDKAYSEYQKAWDDAFNNMENRAQEIADKIEEFFAPVKKIFRDFFEGDFFAAGQDTSNLVAGILNWFADGIDDVPWNEIGQKIGDYLAGINWIDVFKAAVRVIWEGLKGAFELYAGIFQEAPVETGVLTFIVGSKLQKKLSNLIAVYKKFKAMVKDKGFYSAVNTSIKGIRENLTGFQKAIIGVTSVAAEFVLVKDAFYDMTAGSDNLLISIGKLAAGVGVAIGALKLIGLSNPWTAAIVGITGVVAAISGVNQALSEREEMELYGEKLSDLTQRINENSEAIKSRTENSISYVNEAGLAEANMAKDLADRYYELAEKENLTNAEKEEMKNLASTLVDTLPELETYYNTQTGLLDTTRESVENLIEKRLQEIRLSAVEDKLKDAYAEEMNAVDNLSEALEAANTSKERMNELEERYNSLSDKLDLVQQYNDLAEKISVATGDTSELLEESEKLWNAITDNGENTNFLSYDYLISKLGEASNEIGKFRDNYNSTMEALVGATEAYEAVETNITELSSMLSTGMTNAANNSVSGYVNGIESNRKAYDATYQMAKEAISGFADGQDSHSPSREFEKLGRYSVDGYNLGITENMQSTVVTTERYAEKVVNTFSVKIPLFRQIGANIIQGLLDGMSSLETELYKKAEDIADSIAKTVQTALDIHSPSRVMFELGGYTMEGFKDGMENLYNPIETSLKALGGRVKVAPLRGISSSYTTTDFASQISKQNPMQISTQSSGGESEALLKQQNILLQRQNELLLKLLDKPAISNDDVFSAAKAGYRDEARRLGAQGNPQIVWG